MTQPENIFNEDEIYQEISKIVSQFDIFDCCQCAQTVIQWLSDNNIEGKPLRVRTFYSDEDFIISDRLGSQQSITMNGRHYGVEINGLVFDNLSPQGMTREAWLNDFHCQSERFILEELEEL